MLHLLWSLLNLGLFIFFLSICFRAAKLIREHLSLLAAIVFVFGLLSLTGRFDNQNDTQNAPNSTVKKWSFISTDQIVTNTTNYKTIDIDKTLTLTTDIGVKYGREKVSMNVVPIEANSTMVGFVGGFSWKPDLIGVYPTAVTGRLNYAVYGSLRWNLLGATVYTQPKSYSGLMTIEAIR